MIRIGGEVIEELKVERRRQLADRIFAAAPALGSARVAHRYVIEAISAGIRSDRDIAEFTLLLFPVDRAGRPARIDELVCDPRTSGALKLFQIYYALHGERP